MMNNAFYLILKALFVLEIFTFSFRVFGYIEKHYDKKAMINFKNYNITDWIANHRNTHIIQYVRK